MSPLNPDNRSLIEIRSEQKSAARKAQQALIDSGELSIEQANAQNGFLKAGYAAKIPLSFGKIKEQKCMDLFGGMNPIISKKKKSRIKKGKK